MHKSKEKIRETVVLTYAGGKKSSNLSSFQEDKGIKETSRSTETCSQLPSQEKYKWFSWSNLNFKAMLSYPLKFHRTVKRIGQSQTLLHVPEGPRDSKDEHFVESFREMLFLDGLLPPKHNDYHTLLRYVILAIYQ